MDERLRILPTATGIYKFRPTTRNPHQGGGSAPSRTPREPPRDSYRFFFLALFPSDGRGRRRYWKRTVRKSRSALRRQPDDFEENRRYCISIARPQSAQQGLNQHNAASVVSTTRGNNSATERAILIEELVRIKKKNGRLWKG